MNKELNIIEVMNMPIGSEFETYYDGKSYGRVKIKGIKEDNDKDNKTLNWNSEKYGYGQVRITDGVVNLKFIPTQKLVTFDEVLKSSKRCRVEHELVNKITGYNEYSFFNSYTTFDNYIFNLAQELNSEELKKVITEGKWYLEEQYESEED